MEALAAMLNTPVATVLGYGLTAGEAAGFASGLWCVWLAAQGRVLNFPVGIFNSALLLVIFGEARLFADAALQVMFILLGVEGWWRWVRAARREEGPVRHATRAEGVAAVASVAALFGLILPVLGWARGSVPVFDATITALSVVAQVMLNTRRVESWYLWVLVDLISVPVYLAKGLYLIALLYLVFLGLAVRGAWEWRREARGA